MIASAPPDRSYTLLLTHLHNPRAPLELTTLQALLAHHLSAHPSPAPLAARAASSPRLTRPLAHAPLSTLHTAFRSAVHLKWRALRSASTGVFSLAQGRRVQLDGWARAAVGGLAGTPCVARLVCAGGVLMGLEDLRKEVGEGRGRRRAEEEAVLALAEVLDVYGRREEGWEGEFKATANADDADALELALVFASTFMQQIAPQRLAALPLTDLSSHLLSTLETALGHGLYLSALPSSASLSPTNEISLTTPPTAPSAADTPFADPLTSPLASALRTLFASIAYTHAASLSRATAHVLSLLSSARPGAAGPLLLSSTHRLHALAAVIEKQWRVSALRDAPPDAPVAPDSAETATQLWSVLKTHLFATVLVLQSILAAAVHLTGNLPAAELARGALEDLRALAFVLARFGGVEGGFGELKGVFYTSLDVLAKDVEVSAGMVRDMCQADAEGERGGAYASAVRAFQLAVIEQLVPVLDSGTLKTHVVPTCLPLLNNPAHRETYELAHSAVLAIFAAHADPRVRRDTGGVGGDEKGKRAEREPPFPDVMAPYYARCLLENARDGALSAPQLCRAFAALTSSAAASSSAPALAHHILNSLLARLRTCNEPGEQVRLRGALLAALPGLGMPLLPVFAERAWEVIQEVVEEEERDELLEALFRGVVVECGDEEREWGMRWWAERMGGAQERESVPDQLEESKADAEESAQGAA